MREMDALCEFTEHLEGLVCCDVPLKESLSMLAKSKSVSQKLKSLAQEIFLGIESASALSSVLSSCQTISFPRWYVGFVFVAEESGKVGETFSFLKEFLQKKNDVRHSCLISLVYPSFVLGFSLLLSVYFSLKFSIDLVPGISFLLAAAAVMAHWTKKVFSRNELLFLLHGLDFLHSSQIPLVQALRLSSTIVDSNKKLISALKNISADISCGKNIPDSFRARFCEIGMKFEGELLAAQAEFNGKIDSCGKSFFYKAARLIEKKDEKNQKIFASLQQPLLLSVAAIFMLIVFKNVDIYGGLL